MAKVKIYKAEGYGAHYRSVEELADRQEVMEDAVNANTVKNEKVTVLEVTSPHVLAQTNSNLVLVFDEATDAVLNIPDGLNKGTAVIAVNVGTGSIAAAMTGTETARGSLTLADGGSYMSLVKITDTIYQSSEV